MSVWASWTVLSTETVFPHPCVVHSAIGLYLDNPVLVHGDAIIGVFGELEQGLGGRPVHRGILGLQVAHQRGHGPRLPERHLVAPPHAAACDGLRQVPPESVIRLPRMKISRHRIQDMTKDGYVK